MKKQIHQTVWLHSHPHRTEEWLQRISAEGFEIHHIDGDHDNNQPDNLVLVEWVDHDRLHFNQTDISIDLLPKILETYRAGHAANWDIETILEFQAARADAASFPEIDYRAARRERDDHLPKIIETYRAAHAANWDSETTRDWIAARNEAADRFKSD